jgi:hypothetical protein
MYADLFVFILLLSMAAVMTLVVLRLLHGISGPRDHVLAGRRHVGVFGFSGYGGGTYLLHEANSQSYLHMRIRRIVRAAAVQTSDYVKPPEPSSSRPSH